MDNIKVKFKTLFYDISTHPYRCNDISTHPYRCNDISTYLSRHFKYLRWPELCYSCGSKGLGGWLGSRWKINLRQFHHVWSKYNETPELRLLFPRVCQPNHWYLLAWRDEVQEVRHLLVPLLLERTGEIKQSNLGQSIQKKSDRSQVALKMFHKTIN